MNKNTAGVRLAKTLVRVLQQEQSAGTRQLRIARALTEALVARNLGRVNIATSELRDLHEQQGLLERQRGFVVGGLASELGIAPKEAGDHVPLTSLIRALPRAESQPLSAARKQILAVEKDLRAVNARNRKLMESALEYAELSVNLITSAALRAAPYGVNPSAVGAPTFYIDQRA